MKNQPTRRNANLRVPSANNFLSVFLSASLLLFLLPNYMNAQYGSIRLTPSGVNILSSAKLTSINMNGYLTSGYDPNASSVNDVDFVLHHVDDYNLDFSSAGASGFEYEIWDDVSNCANSARTYNCKGVYAIETANQGGGEEYALAGVYDKGVFFATLDGTGAPVTTYRWIFPGSVQTHIYPPMIIESSTPGDYYICGSVSFTGYVMKIKYDGTVYWAKQYSGTQWLDARALMESPYNSKDLVVVGRFDDNTGGTLAAEAMFLVLDAATGSVNSIDLYGWNTSVHSDQWFTSIAEAKSTYGGSAGYILGGFSHTSQGCTCNDWMIKLDTAGGVIWSTIIQPTADAEQNFGINDVFERYNPQGEVYNYEYYGVSVAEDQAGNTDSIVVWRLDETGSTTWVYPNEFSYPTGLGIGNTQFSSQIECVGDGTGTGDGFGAWSTDLSTGDHYFYKNYFGGANGCDGYFKGMSVMDGPRKTISPSISDNNFNHDCQNFSLAHTGNENWNTCWYLTVQGASHRIQSTGSPEGASKQPASVVYPNPASDKLCVALSSDLARSHTEIVITNLLGQTIYCRKLEAGIADGHKFKIKLNDLNIGSGTYYLTIYSKDSTQNHKFVFLKESD